MKLPPSYPVGLSGQYEYLQRAEAQLKIVVPVTLLIIFLLLYLSFRRLDVRSHDHMPVLGPPR